MVVESQTEIRHLHYCPYGLILASRLERKTVKRKRVFATLKVLGSVLEQLAKEIPEEVV